ncbi:response regulator transcription factor [Paenibacillus humicola]|uniref:response regulator transcription factor n=1 Tax=Paenibacillus humicola TaxID=3110540 RepID=UPI00237AF46E|nr:response regulator transcription factor [Paenibacillus humicola]
MPSHEKIRIVLAEDQALVREGLRLILDAQPDLEVVAEAVDGRSAVSAAMRTLPDVILMDIQMPGGTGIEATREILSALPHTKIVLLTTFDVQAYVFDGIRAGAVGYLLKDTDTRELLDGIRWVYGGQVIYRTATASKALAQMMESRSGLEPAAGPDLIEPLSEREIDVLQQMAYGRKNQEIADILHVSNPTVKTHVHRILQKLGALDRTQAVVFALRQGLVQ